MSNQIDATVAKRFDINVKQNQTFDMTISLFDDDGNPINVVGGTFKMSVRQDGCDNSCACVGDNNFSNAFKQDFIANIVGGNQIEFGDVVVLDHGMYKYDLLWETNTGIRKYILTGSFKVKKSYTQITMP